MAPRSGRRPSAVLPLPPRACATLPACKLAPTLRGAAPVPGRWWLGAEPSGPWQTADMLSTPEPSLTGPHHPPWGTHPGDRFSSLLSQPSRIRACLGSIHEGQEPGASDRWREPTHWAAFSPSSRPCRASWQQRGGGLSADIRDVLSSHTSSSLSEAMNVSMALPWEVPGKRSTGDLGPSSCKAKAAED